jgi:hypothetical protein
MLAARLRSTGHLRQTTQQTPGPAARPKAASHAVTLLENTNSDALTQSGE